jgi:hypothetical protein
MIIDEGRDPVDEARDNIEELMYKVAEENSDWFDYKLFRTYLETGKSFRTLAKETGLGIQTIYLSIKKTKLIVADKLFDLYKNTIKKTVDKQVTHTPRSPRRKERVFIPKMLPELKEGVSTKSLITDKVKNN